jgi:hypothetical protein
MIHGIHVHNQSLKKNSSNNVDTKVESISVAGSKWILTFLSTTDILIEKIGSMSGNKWDFVSALLSFSAGFYIFCI